ncbi:MAG: Cell division protein FtsI [Ignavibacteria bacterium]|nr:MAG: Cell division protein FtsI [Ignavibacteria bacterium]KAF0161252.1 MAG: Cell division protein FtsI [Ignavibacteria bacterium]
MINSRALIITGILFSVLIILVIKLFTIQITKHEYYTRIAETQQYKPQIVKAERGLIKDVNGEVLSYTLSNVSFFVDRRMVDNKKIDAIAKVFAKEMGKAKSYYFNKIKSGSKIICIESKVPMDQAIRLKKFVIDGLTHQEDFSRVYPYGNSAAHILGYVDKKNGTGIEGIEKKYNQELTGTNGYFVYERDVFGRILSIDENTSRLPQSGSTIYLTVNKNYQKILEEELTKGLEKFGGKSAVGIIMNPNTGEILALANSPNYDPASYNLSEAESRRNRAIVDTYEPGSTMKSITMAVLYDQKLVEENETVDTENGIFKYKGVTIKDSHKNGILTVRGVLEQSSNIGMAKLVERLDTETFYKYLRDFGFSNKASIDLPSEAEGTLKLPKYFTGISKAFMSYGYELSVTPLQMTAAFSALVNGGVLYQPYITKTITDQKGNILKENQPEKIRNVISAETSKKIRDLMVGVVERGSGTAAMLPNVLVGGKTGTTQRLVNNNYSSSSHVSSFIGFFPAEKPSVVVYVLVNSPTIGRYGGLVAAPIFHETAKRLIESDANLVKDKKPIKRDNKLMEQLIADLRNAPKSSKRSYLNVAEKKAVNDRMEYYKSDTMPNLTDKSVRDAIAQLNAMKVKFKVNGFGKVVWQSIEPGVPINPGTVCTLKCEPANKKVRQDITE